MATLNQDLVFYRDTYHCKLSPLQRRVLARVWERTVAGVSITSEQLAWEMNDAPLPRIRVMVHRIKVALKGTGWTIAGGTVGGAGHIAAYRVVPE